MNLNKIASADASEWARAEMFFGEGAGTRRKLLNAAIVQKSTNIPGYLELFEKAYSKQDMALHAIKAAKERQSIDRSVKMAKNAKALMRGDRRGLSTGVLVIFAIGYYAHQTGYDKVALVEAKKFYRKTKAKLAARKLLYDIDRKGI